MVYGLSREPAKNTTVGSITCNNGDDPLWDGEVAGESSCLLNKAKWVTHLLFKHFRTPIILTGTVPFSR